MEIRALKHGIHFHTDAIAAIPTMSIDLNNPGITSLSMAAHKIYGPKGAGVMFLRKDTPMISLMHGAQQEFNKRAGTENVAAIAATGLCIDILARKRRDEVLKIRRLRDLLLQGIQSNINKWVLNGPIIDRLPCNVNVSFINKAADTLLMQLDAMGICASSGSACSSGAIDDSHVLKAMGLPTCVINGAIRFSIGIYNEEEDVNVLIKALTELCE